WRRSPAPRRAISPPGTRPISTRRAATGRSNLRRMAKGRLGVIVGLAVWVVVVTGGGLILRLSWPAYASVAEAMTFTLPMLIARLTIGAAATLATGWTTAGVTRW